MTVQAEESQSALCVYETLVAALARAPLILVCLVQAEKALCFIFKALFWRTGIHVPCTGTEFIGGFLNPEELNQSCQLENVGISERQLRFLEFSPHAQPYFRPSGLMHLVHPFEPCRQGSKSVCSHTPRLLWFHFGIFNRSLCSLVPLKPTPRFL